MTTLLYNNWNVFFKKKGRQTIDSPKWCSGGLEILEKDEIDIVITDLKMPNMNGLEMIQIAREREYNGPVIIITALSDTDTILKAVDMGIVNIL